MFKIRKCGGKKFEKGWNADPFVKKVFEISCCKK